MIERGVVMTDLKMFSKPVVFTDFDGVLNAFPDDKLLRRGGVNKVMTWAKPDSPYAKMYNPEKAFHLNGNEKAHTPVGSWRIHWSSELSDAMYALAVDGIVVAVHLAAILQSDSRPDARMGSHAGRCHHLVRSCHQMGT